MEGFQAWFSRELKAHSLTDEGFALRAKALGYTLSRSAPRWWRTTSTPKLENCDVIADVFDMDVTEVRHRAHGLPAPTLPGDLTPDEWQLVLVYRDASDHDKNWLDGMLSLAKAHNEDRKREQEGGSRQAIPGTRRPVVGSRQ